MLINLSNHPSSSWPQNQKDMAKAQYGEVVDLPFPQVDPEASAGDIQNLAATFLEQCKAMAGKFGFEQFAVHLMGEMTFSCYLVNLLNQAGVQCVASTTRREVKTNEKGEKVSNFQFIKFREYPGL